MTIIDIIQEYKQALEAEHYQQGLSNGEYDLQAYYHAASITNYWCNMMINHPDWSIELQAEHYPPIPGEIAYPVSC